MRNFCSAVVMALLAFPSPAIAAPIEQITCVVVAPDSELQHLISKTLANGSPVDATSHERLVQLYVTLVSECKKRHLWSDADAENAKRYVWATGAKNKAVEDASALGVDVDMLATYYAANRNIIINQNLSISEIERRLIKDMKPIGYPVSNPKAMKLAWEYVSIRVVLDPLTSDFITGSVR